MKPSLILVAIYCHLSCFINVTNAAEMDPPRTDPQKKPNFTARLGKGLAYKTDDDNFKLRLSGWFQADTAIYNSDLTPLTDGSKIRRGRIALAMQIHRDWSLRGEYDFTTRNMDIRGFQDVYLRYTGLRRSAFMIGNLKELVGLEWQTSSKNTTFMERALSTALLPPYHMGFSASTHGKSWSLASGLFGERLVEGISEGNGWGTSGRVSYSPIHKKSLTLHFGFSGAYRELGNDSASLRFSSRPESNIEDVRFINTSPIRRVVDYKLTGLEFAALSGPFSFQTEYLRTFVNRNHNRDNLEFDGWYAYGSWFVTGESRKYLPTSGKFGHIKPKQKFAFNGGTGAIEVAARYSEVDLNDQRISGGRESNITLGINWYLNSYIRLMGNYVFVQTDNNALGVKGGGSEQPEIFELRAQVEL